MSGTKGLFQIPASITSQLYSFLLVAIPLYVLMGELIFVSGIGRDIYNAFSKWLNRVPGGLAIATIYSCALFGAMCGVSIAGVAAIGTMAIPEMLKRGYDRKLAAGAVAAPGALAVLIPPSILREETRLPQEALGRYTAYSLRVGLHIHRDSYAN